MFKILAGMLLGVLMVPLAVLVWFEFGRPPVAVSDPQLPRERQFAHFPLNKRIVSELAQTIPIQATEGNLIAGAEVYRDQCAACHGLHGKPSSFAAHMYPRAPQLWETHKSSSVVGVSDDEVAATYWKVANGIRLTGMPEYKKILSETEMWQVSLLLANANKPLPAEAVEILRGKTGSATAPAAPTVSTAKK
jgi:mono/diheme cytochrome c family protein